MIWKSIFNVFNVYGIGMRITYDCNFVYISYFVYVNLFISHTKIVNAIKISIKFIDKFLILTRNKHNWRFFFKYSNKYLSNSKKTGGYD